MRNRIKKIVLTIDYELHFGRETGNVKECMIDPTYILMNLCEQYNSKMTIFWDILHYYKLMEMENLYPEINNERKLIKKQIIDLVKKGHDIQLHLHSHWLDAEYKNSKWIFKYDRFSLQKLSHSRVEDDINTIIGCVKLSKELMEKIIKPIDPSYRVNTFRAGGYLIEPFNVISDALEKNDILIDSSVCPNLSIVNDIFSYNFKNYPKLNSYTFDESPSKINNIGNFTEIPIKTIYISKIRNLYFLLLKKIKYRNLEQNRKGSGAGLTTGLNKKNNFLINFNKIFRSYHNQLTSDSCFKEKYNFLLSKSDEFSVQILHPKLLNEHMISVMLDKLKTEQVRFISVNNYFSKYYKKT